MLGTDSTGNADSTPMLTGNTAALTGTPTMLNGHPAAAGALGQPGEAKKKLSVFQLVLGILFPLVVLIGFNAVAVGLFEMGPDLQQSSSHSVPANHTGEIQYNLSIAPLQECDFYIEGLVIGHEEWFYADCDGSINYYFNRIAGAYDAQNNSLQLNFLTPPVAGTNVEISYSRILDGGGRRYESFNVDLNADGQNTTYNLTLLHSSVVVDSIQAKVGGPHVERDKQFLGWNQQYFNVNETGIVLTNERVKFGTVDWQTGNVTLNFSTTTTQEQHFDFYYSEPSSDEPGVGKAAADILPLISCLAIPVGIIAALLMKKYTFAIAAGSTIGIGFLLLVVVCFGALLAFRI
jgi:hypothetical protein